MHISQAVDITNQKLMDIRSGKIKPLVTSSKKETDKIGGLFPTDQMVIAARTGIGKTADVLWRMQDFVDPVLNPHYADKMIILYDSWEMPEWRNVLRMYSRVERMTVKDILDYERKITEEAFNRLIFLKQRFAGLPIYFKCISDSVEQWYNNKYAIQNANPDKLIVNIADHTRLVTKTTERSEEELISRFMIKGMKVKNDLKQINIFLSQMNRAIETSGKREEIGMSTPVSSDIFGADSVFQCADVVIALHRPGFYGLIDWHDIPTGKQRDNPEVPDDLWVECVLKQRDGWTGNIIRKHDLKHNQFSDGDLYSF